jgi:hypothetical protein
MVMGVRIVGTALAVAGCAALVGCSGGSAQDSAASVAASASSAAAAAQDTISDIGKPNKPLDEKWNADALTKAFGAIDDKVGATPADYLQISITDYAVTAQAINPNKRQNVDAYAFDGKTVKTEPVDVSNNEPGAVEQAAFKSDAIKPDVVVAAIKKASTEAGVEDGAVESVMVTKFFADEPAPYIQVPVKGPRETKTYRFDLQGNVTSVN